jgi:hypothetical protein
MNRYLAALGMAALLALTACGSSPTASSSSAGSAPGTGNLSALATCLGQHGVQVGSPATRRDIRAALRGVPKSTRHGAVAACQQYAGGILDHPGKQRTG